MDFEFILLYIIIPGLLGGIFAPKLVKACRKLYQKWSNKNK